MGRVYDATWGRIFTAYYGLFMRCIDEVGLRETRRAVVEEARGRTLEIGSGTGANLRLYPPELELVLAEPDRHMLKVLKTKLAESESPGAELIQAPAERLPFDSDSFDSAVCTMVLCTTPDPAAALSELARVLRPGGRFLFMEHVRSEDPGFARWQDRWEKPWRFLADGCYCNRDSLATIESSPFRVEEVRRSQMPLAPLFLKPIVSGTAVLPA